MAEPRWETVVFPLYGHVVASKCPWCKALVMPGDEDAHLATHPRAIQP